MFFTTLIFSSNAIIAILEFNVELQFYRRTAYPPKF